jgi:hypothetical protein
MDTVPLLLSRAHSRIAFADIPAVLAKEGIGAMIMKSGERWHCINPACGCSVLVETNGEVQGENPRCACGGLMKKDYSPPVFRHLDFLHLNEPALARRISSED